MTSFHIDVPSDDLKPCPFCGSTSTLCTVHQTEEKHFDAEITCLECNASIPGQCVMDLNEDDHFDDCYDAMIAACQRAVQAWNRRPGPRETDAPF